MTTSMSAAAVSRREARARILGGDGLLWLALAPLLIVTAIVGRLAATPVDPDYWWHLATGRWMLDHGSIPTTDPFSFVHAGQNWYAHEWLAELILGVADRVGGYAAGLTLTAVIAVAGIWLGWRTARYYGANLCVAMLLVVGGSLFWFPFLAVRPQVWAFALFAFLLHELAAHDTDRRSHLWYLPLLFALWININLLAFHGIIALGLYAAHRALRWWTAPADRKGYERRRFLQIVVIGLASAAALCLNPRGPMLLWFSRVYLDQSATFYRTLQEWLPMPFAGFDAGLYIAGALAVAFLVVVMARRRVLWPGVLMVVFAVAAMRSARYVPLFSLAAVPALAWATVWLRGRRLPGSPIIMARPIAIALTIIVVLSVTSTFAFGFIRVHRVADPILAPYPIEATAWIRANVTEPRIFDEYGWGGYLIEQLYPDRAVYIDGREEMYGQQHYDRYLAAIAALPGWQATLAAGQINVVLIDPVRPLAAALANDPGWRRVQSDSTAALFVPVPGLTAGSSAR